MDQNDSRGTTARIPAGNNWYRAGPAVDAGLRRARRGGTAPLPAAPGRAFEFMPGPFAGQGPKGYSATDARILDDVCRSLERDGAVDARGIEVACDNGIVRLNGTIADREMRSRAQLCCSAVEDVSYVVNELRVDPGPKADES